MLTWLIVKILAYFFFSLSYLGDKLILSGPPKAASYTFFVGALSVLVIFLIPFIRFGFPGAEDWIWIFLTSVVYVAGLYTMFEAVEKFEVSKVMTTIGATQPIFIFALSWFFFSPTAMSKTNILAFILLLLGSIIISFKKNSKTAGNYLVLTIFSSVMFSLDYVFQKIVFLKMPFWQGLIWTRVFIFLVVLVFLFSRKARKEIFTKKGMMSKKTGIIFVCSQASGGLANFLQSFAIFLAPVAFLPIVNSLRGVQYVFLFLMTLFLSVLFPKILKEDISKRVLIQKIISIILIAVGLGLLVL
jgi:drug/metabolite transporter (DMT)-like permease